MNNSLLLNIIGVGIIYKGQGIDLKVYALQNNRLKLSKYPFSDNPLFYCQVK